MSKATQKNIKMLLDMTGVTHKQLGEIAGVDRSAVSHWVSGKSEPRMGPLQRIADYYGLRISNFTDIDGMRYVKRSPDGRLHEDRKARVSDLRKMVLLLDDDESMESKVLYDTISEIMSCTHHLSHDEDQLVKGYRSLDATGRQIVLAIVLSLVKSGDYRLQ